MNLREFCELWWSKYSIILFFFVNIIFGFFFRFTIYYFFLFDSNAVYRIFTNENLVHIYNFHSRSKVSSQLSSLMFSEFNCIIYVYILKYIYAFLLKNWNKYFQIKVNRSRREMLLWVLDLFGSYINVSCVKWMAMKK